MPNNSVRDPVYQISVYHQILSVEDGELTYSPSTYSVIHPDGVETMIPMSVVSSPDRCFEMFANHEIRSEMQYLDIQIVIDLDQFDRLLQRASPEHVELLQYLHHVLAEHHLYSVDRASKEISCTLDQSITLLDQQIQIPDYLMVPMFMFDPDEEIPDHAIYYHLKTRKIIRIPRTEGTGVRFRYRGGVIESNTPLAVIERLVERYPDCEIDSEQQSIILPEHLERFCASSHRSSRIGIFVDLFPDQYARVTHLAQARNYLAIWVIQTMPYLWYYRGPSALNGMDRLMRIWSCYGSEHTRKHKQDHYLFLITRFDQFYRIHYEPEPTQCQSSLVTRLTEAYQLIYTKWEEYQLAFHNPEFRIASDLFHQICRAITKIKSAIVYLAAIATVPTDCIETAISARLAKLAQDWGGLVDRCQNIVTHLSQINQLYPAQELGEEECSYEYLVRYREYLQDATKILAEMSKLRDAGYLTLETDCPICYCEAEIYLICGHRICIDCLPPTLSNKDSCPICKSLLCLSFVTIDAGSNAEQSDYRALLELGASDLLIGSNLDCFQELPCQRLHVLEDYHHDYPFQDHPRIVVLIENCARDLASWLGRHLDRKYPGRVTILQLPEIITSEHLG